MGIIRPVQVLLLCPWGPGTGNEGRAGVEGATQGRGWGAERASPVKGVGKGRLALSPQTSRGHILFSHPR